MVYMTGLQPKEIYVRLSTGNMLHTYPALCLFATTLILQLCGEYVMTLLEYMGGLQSSLLLSQQETGHDHYISPQLDANFGEIKAPSYDAHTA